MKESIKDKVALVGMGCSKFGERFDCSLSDLIIEAAYEAYQDANPGGIFWERACKSDCRKPRGRHTEAKRDSDFPQQQLVLLRSCCLNQRVPGCGQWRL